jgi:hypothetical protein
LSRLNGLNKFEIGVLLISGVAAGYYGMSKPGSTIAPTPSEKVNATPAVPADPLALAAPVVVETSIPELAGMPDLPVAAEPNAPVQVAEEIPAVPKHHHKHKKIIPDAEVATAPEVVSPPVSETVAIAEKSPEPVVEPKEALTAAEPAPLETPAAPKHHHKHSKRIPAGDETVAASEPMPTDPVASAPVADLPPIAEVKSAEEPKQTLVALEKTPAAAETPVTVEAPAVVETPVVVEKPVVAEKPVTVETPAPELTPVAPPVVAQPAAALPVVIEKQTVVEKTVVIEAPPAKHLEITTPKLVDDDNEDWARGFFTIAPYYLLSEISSKDLVNGGTSNLTSQLNAGFNFAYSQEWNKDFTTFIDLKLGYISMNKIAAGVETLDSGSAFMDSVGIGMTFGNLKDSSFSLKTEISDTKELFERSISATSVTVDSVSTPEIHAEPSFKIVAKKPFVLGASIPLGVYFPTSVNSYTTRTGVGYGAKIFLLHDLGRDVQLSTEAGFLIRNQDTSVTSQSQTDLGFSVGLTIPLGEDPKKKKGENAQ